MGWHEEVSCQCGVKAGMPAVMSGREMLEESVSQCMLLMHYIWTNKVNVT